MACCACCTVRLLGVHLCAAAAKATKGDIAWRLLHDASITVGKEQAVLLPEIKKVSRLELLTYHLWPQLFLRTSYLPTGFATTH